jgi:hypothetical protein
MATFTIFYSWQSDSPKETNKWLIDQALRAAGARLETERVADDLHVVIDEATRDVPGRGATGFASRSRASKS